MTGFEPATPATRTQCATKLRYIPIFYIFCILSTPRSLVLIEIWLPLHSPSALHSDFLYFCILSTLTQFGFNWNLASVPLAKCATFRFFIFFVFYRPSRSLVLIGIWLPFHSPSALFRFLYVLLVLTNNLYNNIIPKKLKIKPIFMKNFNR